MSQQYPQNNFSNPNGSGFSPNPTDPNNNQNYFGSNSGNPSQNQTANNFGNNYQNPDQFNQAESSGNFNSSGTNFSNQNFNANQFGNNNNFNPNQTFDSNTNPSNGYTSSTTPSSNTSFANNNSSYTPSTNNFGNTNTNFDNQSNYPYDPNQSNNSYNNPYPASQPSNYNTPLPPDPYAQNPLDSYSTDGGINKQSGSNYNDYNQQNFTNAPLDKNNTDSFKEKKTGNKALLIGSVVVVVLLLITSIVIFLVVRGNQNDTSQPSDSGTNSTNDVTAVNESSISSEDSSIPSDNTEDSSNENSEFSTSSSVSSQTFNPNATPAENARLASRSSGNIDPSWLAQYFFNNGVDQNNVCQNPAICSVSADPDEDGLNNLEEYQYDTDPQNEDSDRDQISDGNEVKVYFTSPRENDSDQDGTLDGLEIIACTDPIANSRAKMSSARLTEISKEAKLSPLRSSTIRFFSSNGASAADIEQGYISSQCQAVTFDQDSSVSSVPSNDQAQNNQSPIN